jgi:biotin-dependent carboxylase-like uncharacterized protein
MIELIRAPAYATVQDGGREGFRSSGVPPGGAMDRLSLFAGNVLLGNDPKAAAIEWALTGGALRFHGETSFVLAGATAEARLGTSTPAHGRVLHARAGDLLKIERLAAGRFLYICVRGGIDVPVVLGGRGTYLPAAFGGLDGRRLGSGDRLAVGSAPGAEPATRELPRELHVLGMSGPLGLLQGPQSDTLPAEQWRALAEAQLVVTQQSDRTGYRLAGLEIHPPAIASRKSEPSCPGAVQLTPAGELIVLMADGPTVGGYPKIGVVAAAHLPRLAQAAVGERVRFRLMEPAEAVTLLAGRQSDLRRLRVTNSGRRP